MGRRNWFYRVEFKEPPLTDDERTEFFFTSLAAIYEVFTPEQIGCKVNRLWNIGVTDGITYNGKRCLITREVVHSKAQKAPYSGAKMLDDSLHQEKT